MSEAPAGAQLEPVVDGMVERLGELTGILRAQGTRVGVGELLTAVRCLERVDVDPQAIGLEPDTVIAASQRLRPDRLSGEMHGFAQVSARSIRREVGPQDVHQLFSVKAMPRRQGKQLNQRAGLPPVPSPLRHRLTPDLGPEPEVASRGRGIGKALLAYVAAIAMERGCARMQWDVLDWNTPAIDFYRSCGAVMLEPWRIMRVTGAALARLAKPPAQRT